MSDFSKYSLDALLEEWWELVSGDLTTAIGDKIMLSKHFGLRVEGFGETPDIHFEPMDEESHIVYKVMEETLTRFSKFPQENHGSYYGIHGDSRPYIQCVLMVIFNLGFRCALASIKTVENNKNVVK